LIKNKFVALEMRRAALSDFGFVVDVEDLALARLEPNLWFVYADIVVECETPIVTKLRHEK
jgi:hypothetical protein